VEIRLVRERDLPAVEEIERKSFTDPWSKLSFQQSLLDPSCLFLVAEDRGKVVGYALAWVVLGELHIGNLAVRPERRREGIGRGLLAEIVNQGVERGCKLVSLELRESNQIALSLYTQEGFKLIGVRRNYYRQPREDALVMIKELGDGVV